MVQMIADRLGVELDEIRETFEREYTREAFETPMMHVPKETCAAVHFRVEGMAYGRPVAVAEHVNRLRDDIAPHWPMPPPVARVFTAARSRAIPTFSWSARSPAPMATT
jgi:4-hydroxy-tetrahydrodipicolinate reductase